MYLLITSLALAFPTLSGGCEGGNNAADMARAKEFMQTGDEWMAKVEADFQIILETRSEMMDKATGDDAHLRADEIDEIADNLESASNIMANSLKQARAAYQEIKSLEDARDYKEYAITMLEMIAEYEASSSMRQSLDLQSAATPAASENNLNSLKQKAEAIKSEKKL